MKRFMKVFANGSVIVREWGTIGLLKKVYVEECTGSRLVGQLQKRWIDSVSNYLKGRFEY